MALNVPFSIDFLPKGHGYFSSEETTNSEGKSLESFILYDENNEPYLHSEFSNIIYEENQHILDDHNRELIKMYHLMEIV